MLAQTTTTRERGERLRKAWPGKSLLGLLSDSSRSWSEQTGKRRTESGCRAKFVVLDETGDKISSSRCNASLADAQQVALLQQAANQKNALFDFAILSSLSVSLSELTTTPTEQAEQPELSWKLQFERSAKEQLRVERARERKVATTRRVALGTNYLSQIITMKHSCSTHKPLKVLASAGSSFSLSLPIFPLPVSFSVSFSDSLQVWVWEHWQFQSQSSLVLWQTHTYFTLRKHF